MKKILAIIICVLLVFSIAACGGGGTSTPTGGNAPPAPPAGGEDAAVDAPAAPAPEGATTLTFWTFVHSHIDYMQAVAEIWNAQNPDRQVVLDAQEVPWGTIWENLQMALTTGNGAPDIIDIEINQATQYLSVPNPPLLPQNAALEQYLPYLVMARVDPYTVNGNIYGVCYHIGAVLMFYNQGLFDQAGLDWNDIVTWDDFIAMGKEMKDRTGAWMTMMDSNLFGFDPLVAQQHSQYIVNNMPEVNTPEAIRALQLMQDMVYVHEMARIMPGYALDSEEHYAAFNNGEGAALWAPAWFLGRFINQMPDLAGQISVGPLPVFQAGNNRSSSAGGTMTAITNQIAPEKADLALDFVAFAKASYEGALLQWTLLGFDPVRWDVFEDPAMTGPSPAVDYFGVDFAEQFFALLYDIQAETAAIDADQPNQFEIREYIIQYVMPNVLRENNETAKDALDEAQARLTAELS